MSEESKEGGPVGWRAEDVETRFSDILISDERAGYEGYLVHVDHLLDFAATIRDELGFDYLSSVTGVDYLPDGKMEVVYHVYRTAGGGHRGGLCHGRGQSTGGRSIDGGSFAGRSMCQSRRSALYH